MTLTGAQIEAYRRDGFVAPLDVFAAAEAASFRRELEAFEASLPPGPVARHDRRKLHVRLPWMRDLVEDSRLLDIVEALIGPDILVFTSTFFIKEPGTDATAAWHQDATYFGLAPHEHVTAWIAVSDASVEAGCMEFVRGSHRLGQLRHAPQSVAGSINAGAQSLAAPIDAGDTGLAPLRPGQVSLHHTLVVHRSAENRGRDRRIGLGVSYIPTRVRHGGSMRISATLVRGADRFGHFELEPDPRRLAPEQRAAAHEAAFRTYRAGYDEQIAHHAAQG
jgi:non-haem Fe2+, alpha-ketoglutarate-dependent halogenase